MRKKIGVKNKKKVKQKSGVKLSESEKNKKKSNEKRLKLAVILKTNAYNGTKSKKN
jgi:hypothetical protein